MKIILAAVIAREALAGLSWVWLQYLLGFRRLGHEVYFLEESGEWPYVYDFEAMAESDDPTLGAAYIERFLTPFGLSDRWAYRFGDSCLGLSRDEFVQVCHEADLFIALPTAVWSWRPEYDAPRVRLFLDVDPGFCQFRAQRGDWPIPETLDRCNRFFTYGPGINAADSPVPKLDRFWQATLPPVVLEQWPVRQNAGAERLTTLMHWSHDPSPEFAGQAYGQKDVEFERILHLPRRTAQPLEVALAGGPVQVLREHGWHVVSSSEPSAHPHNYRRYIQSARGEFSVAKNGYVKTACGWISDRTACFLATGKPALVQETGLSRWLPTGEGLLTFSTLDNAVSGIEQINADYEHHGAAARRLAEAYFDSDVVLTRLLDEAGA